MEEELEYVNTYLTLEQARFDDKPKVRMKLDPRVLNLRIPVLTIQPLVENAGGHGLAPEEDWGWVMVSSRIRRDELRLIVADRGVVILPERLAHVFGAGGRNPKVVFVTAYEEYAVNAFKVRATDYLLKPFDDARLDDTVQRLLEGRNGREARPEGKKPQPPLAWVPTEVNGTTVPVPVEDIVYIYSEKDYVFVRTFADKLITRFTLQELA